MLKTIYDGNKNNICLSLYNHNSGSLFVLKIVWRYYQMISSLDYTTRNKLFQYKTVLVGFQFSLQGFNMMAFNHTKIMTADIDQDVFSSIQMSTWISLILIDTKRWDPMSPYFTDKTYTPIMSHLINPDKIKTYIMTSLLNKFKYIRIEWSVSYCQPKLPIVLREFKCNQYLKEK